MLVAKKLFRQPGRREGQKCLVHVIFASKNWVGQSVGNFWFSGNFSVKRVLLTFCCIWGFGSVVVWNAVKVFFYLHPVAFGGFGGGVLWSAVRVYYFLFIWRLSMKFSTFFLFIKLCFSKVILTSFNVTKIRLLRILHNTLSRP